ncbi:hypothetical protein [Variovorax sp. AFSI2.2]|uniref:hypothetical protein n=1 Tax=Variovorax sp. AFSI2.2 TaxID=3384160 RepID=UPI003EBC5E5C
MLVSPEGEIAVHRPWAPSPHLEYSRFDLREARLAPTPFVPYGTSVADRPDLREAVIQGLNASLRVTRPSKSQHRTLILRARCLVKTIEFGWLTGIYRMSDWTVKAYETLATKLASGGWIEALDVHARVDRLLDDMSAGDIHALWLPSHSSQYRLDGRKLARLMHCNIGLHEVYRLQEYVARRLGAPTQPKITKPQPVDREPVAWSRTALRSELAIINLFADGSNASLSFRPFPRVETFVKRFASSQETRTPSLGPDDAAALLKGAVRWIESIAPLLQDVLLEFFEKYKLLPKPHISAKARSAMFLTCRSLPALEEALACKVTQVDKLRDPVALDGVTSLHSVVKLLYAACFIVIALFNARRKDEVQHPVIGLQTGSLSVVDKQLGLYICSFYIEKNRSGLCPVLRWPAHRYRRGHLN